MVEYSLLLNHSRRWPQKTPDLLREAVVMTPEIAGSGAEEELDKAFIHDFVRSEYSGWTAEQVRILQLSQ